MSFQATEWARGLPLHSLSAKFTLMMIGSYAGADGTCFPSLPTLAEDTLQSVDTVRRRIRELEQLGLLARFARWTSPDGAVVLLQAGDGARPAGCRQSSDELRLYLKATAREVESRIEALGWRKKDAADQDDTVTVDDSSGVADCNPVPPSTSLPSTPSQADASPPLASGCNPLKRLSNSSGETPPSSPPENGGTTSDFEPELRKTGRKRLEAVMPIWPEPITDAERAAVVLGALTEDEFADCLVGVKGFAAFTKDLRDHGKHRVVKDFHNWARGKQWVGFVAKGAEVEAGGRRIHALEDSPEGRAWRTLHKIARIEPKAYDGRYLLPGPMTPQLLAFAEAPLPSEWHFIPETEKQQVGAWNRFLRKALGERARPALVDDRNWRGSERIGERGFLAPWPWPPGVDGKIYTTGPPSEEVA